VAAKHASLPQSAVQQPIGLDALRRAGFVAATTGTTRSRITEELNVVQHQVLRTIQATEPAEGRIARLVMVTSAKPGEGKSFCALNIAARLAISTTDQIILVDGDSKRRGSLTSLLGQQDAPGLRDLAADALLRPEIQVLPTAIPRLSFLPLGRPVTELSALPSGEMLAAAIGRLAAAMPGRTIVLDMPPCLSTSEPSALAAISGQVVLVVEAESTQHNEVEGALDMIESCPTLQLVLNRTRLATSDTFGAHGSYGG
jgi:receptor protein-tyrosine kinase